VTKIIRRLSGLLLPVALMTLAAQAAAPPGPYSNGFEKNTDGWFDMASGHYGTLTRQPSGYSNSGGYGDVSDSTFSLDDSSQTITMIGTGVHDGLPVGFTMIAVDNGPLASGVFTLILTDGYVVTGSLPVGGLVIE
jgi:hypothetical protein